MEKKSILFAALIQKRDQRSRIRFKAIVMSQRTSELRTYWFMYTQYSNWRVYLYIHLCKLPTPLNIYPWQNKYIRIVFGLADRSKTIFIYIVYTHIHLVYTYYNTHVVHIYIYIWTLFCCLFGGTESDVHHSFIIYIYNIGKRQNAYYRYSLYEHPHPLSQFYALTTRQIFVH